MGTGHGPARRLDDGLDSAPGIDIEDADPGLVGVRCHQAAFDGEWADTGQHVPAGGRRIDDGLVEPHLRKAIVDIDTRPLRRTDHRHLARHRGGASEPVDLTRVGPGQGHVRLSHRAELLMNKEMYTVIGVGVALAAILITSLGGLRAEMRDEHAAIRAEMREGQAALRTEMREGFAAVRTELKDMRADIALLGERVARIEIRLDIPFGESSTAAQ